MRQLRSLTMFSALSVVLVTTAAVIAQQPPPKPPQQPPGAAAGQKPAEAKPPEKPVSTTKFLTSKDGTKIAYETAGSGPAIMLLHGAGQTRAEWQRTDYVKRLAAANFTAISVDLRGNGESDKPTKVEAYAIDRFVEDLLAVADAAGAQRFHIWGYAYGGIIGRSVAARTDRVRSLAYIGVPFGPAASGLYKDAIEGFRARWQPVIAAHDAGKLDRSTISPGDYEALTKGGVKLAVAWQGALVEYPPMEPADAKVPTLWMVASGDTDAMASIKAYEGKLAGTKVTVATVDGPTHSETLQRIDLTFDKLVEFTKKAESGS